MRESQSSFSRRDFLKSSGGVALFVGVSGILPQLVSCASPEKIKAVLEKHSVTAWVKLDENGSITIFNPASEMGQGSMTSLPLLFTEEMDADWEKVTAEFSPQETEIYGSPGWSPDTKLMFTVGSRTTNSYYMTMRQAGAQARYVLLSSVGKKWNVPISELSTSKSTVIHEKSGKLIGYGEIISFLEIPESIPSFSPDQLKKNQDFQLVGKKIARKDIPEKVNGTAKFSIDIRLPEMVYGVIERGNLHGSKPSLLNESEVMASPGVLKIIPIEYGIGIVASTLEDALVAKKILSIKWSESAASTHNSQETYTAYEKMASSSQPGKVLEEKGNVKLEQNLATKTYLANFKNDYIYHAQMEPLNAVVKVSKDLSKAEVWVGSQQGFDSKLGVPSILGIDPEKVTIHLQYLGGGFGRRSMNDFVEECAILAKEMAPAPVKLIWTREDDLTYGAYRPLSLQQITASTDQEGNLSSFSHLVVGDGGNLVASGTNNSHYDIPNQFVEWREASNCIRLKHWRSVGHGANKFAIECMLDEIAHDQGKDPIKFRKNLMANSPRALATIEKVEKLSNWGTPSESGKAKGVAFVEHGSLGSGVCEISLNRESGKINIHNFWVALDAGVIVHPDNVKAQIEGGIMMGISSALKEQITIIDGKVQQSNFHDYQILRMEDIPDQIETELIASDAHPEGVGETATPMVACAIANAFLALTGKKLRHLPFTPERVLEALNS